MKKIVSLLAALAFFTSAVFAEPLSSAASSAEQIADQTVETGSIASSLFAQTDNPAPEKDSPPLILRIDNVFSFYDYQSFDGIPLKFKEVKALLNTVPENQALMSKRIGVVIANWTFAALGFASGMAAGTYYFIPDLPHAKTMLGAALITAGLSFFGEIITYQWNEDLFQRAVDNYNLSIMGIPIPIKK